MPRLCSSLGAIRRLASIDSQAQRSSSALRACASAHPSTAVLDFLAPSFCNPSVDGRRNSASVARVVLGPSDVFESTDHVAGPSTSSATPSSAQASSHRQFLPTARRADITDFSTFFDADAPTSSPFASGRSPFLLGASQIKEAAEMDARINAAQDAEELGLVAKQIYRSDSLRAERARAHAIQISAEGRDGGSMVVLRLHEHLIISLLGASLPLAERIGQIHLASMHKLVADYLWRVHRRSAHGGFSAECLCSLTNDFGSVSTVALLDRLLIIVKERVARFDVESAAATEEAASTFTASYVRQQRQVWSRTLLNLMQAYSCKGRSHSVTDCFQILTEHSLPTNVLHHQLRLISWFRRYTHHLSVETNQADIESESREIQDRVLEALASIKADGIHLDDTFLATVVSGLSAPLRNPLAALTSVEHKKLTRKLVRSVFRRYASTASGQGRGSLPRALSALIAAEIDTLQVIPDHEAALRANSVDRIQTSIGQLDAASAPEASPVAGTLNKLPFSESQLAGACLRLRLYAALGDMDRAMAELRRVLLAEPVSGHNEACKNHYELVLKQRGGVISLFSAAMQRREEHKGQDAGYEVLKAAISSRWFVRVWTGSALPSNPSLDFDPEDYEGEATILRLWKRWMHAWSIDYWTEGSKAGARADEGIPDALDGRPKYHTFTGSYPWQTLKRGLKLLNLTMDQYEAFHSGQPLLAPSRSSTNDDLTSSSADLASIGFALDTNPPPYIAQFSCLFNERNMLDNIVYLCLHGGRTPKGETMATHVQRRLSLLVRTLTRVHVPARTWEHVEASMLRHLAEIPCEVLPTELVRPTMEAIEQGKRTALLRNRDLVKTLQEQAGAQDPPETGTIFVLRQMLKQRALDKAQAQLKPHHALTH